MKVQATSRRGGRIPAADPAGTGPTSASAVRLDDVSFAYSDGTHVLESLSLDIPKGSIVGVVGPSGGGKSTMLSLIAGLLSPTRGTVTRSVPAKGRHPLSMVFQKDTLLPWMTVEENARAFERYKGHRSARKGAHGSKGAAAQEVSERVDSLLRLAHLDASRSKYPYQLSGGMRRRLAFVSAASLNPDILLLDEPFSSVDEPTRVGIHQDVYKIARTLGTTMVLVTHDLAEAITLCDRVVILSARPATIAHDHAVPFDSERSMMDLRDTAAYLELYGTLWKDLSNEISLGQTGGVK